MSWTELLCGLRGCMLWRSSLIRSQASALRVHQATRLCDAATRAAGLAAASWRPRGRPRRRRARAWRRGGGRAGLGRQQARHVSDDGRVRRAPHLSHLLGQHAQHVEAPVAAVVQHEGPQPGAAGRAQQRRRRRSGLLLERPVPCCRRSRRGRCSSSSRRGARREQRVAKGALGGQRQPRELRVHDGGRLIPVRPIASRHGHGWHCARDAPQPRPRRRGRGRGRQPVGAAAKAPRQVGRGRRGRCGAGCRRDRCRGLGVLQRALGAGRFLWQLQLCQQLGGPQGGELQGGHRRQNQQGLREERRGTGRG
jgi:hypothetical protein